MTCAVGYLLGLVVPVAGEAVDRGGLEQPGLVVAAQRPHTQVRQRGELPDGQSGAHESMSSLLTLP